MRVHGEHALDIVVVFELRGLLAAAAAVLALVVGERLDFCPAGFADGEHDHFLLDEVGERDVFLGGDDFGAAWVLEIAFVLQEFVADDAAEALGVLQDVEQVGDFGDDFLVVGAELFLLQAGELLQAHFEDGASLRWRELVAYGGVALEAVVLF